MPYVVLARKYRPRGFSALLGQEPVVQALSNALARGRLHHAYLFTGTRGVGKTTVSRILAKALNCVGPDGQGGVTATPCGVCMPCTAIDGGRFVDYVELDAASNRGVDEMSQLLDQSVYKPVVGRYKVYLIDEVHMLSTTAFNAMLKTLEEPPEYLKFVLATTDPQKVPATVLSRCLQFTLRPLAPATVQAHLAEVLQAEQVAAEPGALRLLARAARGSMRDALSLADQAIAHGAGSVSEQGVRAMLGTVERGQAAAIVEALAAGDGAALVSLADALLAAGLSAGGALDDLAQLLQRIAVAQAAPDAGDAADPDTADARRLVALLLPDELHLYYSMALHGRVELALAPDEHSGLVMALLRMLVFRQPGPGRGAVTGVLPAVREQAVPAMERSASEGDVPPLRKPVLAAAAPLVRRTHDHASLPLARPNPAPEPVPEPPTAPPRVAAAAAHAEAWDDDVDMLDNVAALSEPEPEPAERPESPTHAEPESAATDAPADRWNALVLQMDSASRITALTRELAFQSDCIAVADDGPTQVWHLRAESEMLRAAPQRDKLERALAEALQRPVRLELVAGSAVDTPAKRVTQARRERQAQAERSIEAHPVVRSLLARYSSARIVPGSIKPV